MLTLSIQFVVALVLLILSVAWAIRNRDYKNPTYYAILAIAVIVVFGRL